ncbi:MAG: signal peptide peptidase SppA [Verrucomicrobia subdivision 3 bacterium]|nr:signal peptide peptidase SppA [Limisphaerales bacterium]
MSDHETNPTPPVLPQNPQPYPRSTGAGRWVFTFLFLTLGGILLLGGWFVSSVGEAMDSLAAPADLYSETIVRSGDTGERIAIVPVTGVITSYGLSAEQNMVTRIKKQFDLAAADSRIKAVILHIDSPGGEVLASDEIHKAIVDFQADTGKPVIASMGGMAASGGYYVAAPCQLIVANKLTITGSIGVIMQSINLHGLMDKVGVQAVTIKSGANKDMLSPFNPPEDTSDEQQKILQDFIDSTYEQFATIVKDGREKKGRRTNKHAKELVADWKDYADGRILTGAQALELGMVDKLGNFDAAIRLAEDITGIPEDTARLVRHDPPVDYLGIFNLFTKSSTPPAGSTVKVDLGLNPISLRPGLPYYIAPHLFAQ